MDPRLTLERWQRWLQQREVILLMDGLDEIVGGQDFTDTLTSSFNLYKGCPTVVTCRTLSSQRHQAFCPDFPVFTLADLSREQWVKYIQDFPRQHPEQFDPEALVKQLDLMPQMSPIIMNPLLLSIVCFVVDEGVPLPATRAQLYDKAMNKLLGRKTQRVMVTYPRGNPDIPVTRKRRILEQAALAMFVGDGRERQLVFDQETLLDALAMAARQEGYQTDPVVVADAVVQDLLNSGILRGDEGSGYSFLHPTIYE